MRFMKFVLLVCAAVVLLATPASGWAQGEWVQRLDRDGNGYLEPDEIPERALPHLEKMVRPYGLTLRRPQPVEKLEQVARLIAQRQQRGSQPLPAVDEKPMGVQGFGVKEDEPVVPGFGLAQVKYPYTQEDINIAESVLRRFDRDRDGFLSRQEIEDGRWGDDDPWNYDFNNDQRLSKLELAQRYAARREQEQPRVLTLGRLSEWDEQSNRQEPGRPSLDRVSAQRAGTSLGGDRGSRSLAASVIERYDFNRNNQLEPQEMASVGIPIAKVDFNRDGAVDQDELARYLFEEMEREATRSQEGIPTWFFERDINGDQQVDMSEFATEWDDATFSEFATYDTNQDGIITIEEILAAKTVVGGQFANTQAQIILPRSTVVSEIEVDEDYLIGDLNVQLSISHTYTGQLDGYLIGPDGERIELFTSVGGSDDHFDQTIFDDDVDARISRARPPFRGSYRPEALDERKPGLNQYKGKNLKGVWQLMIRAARSERSGILHGWSLIVQPDQEAVDRPQTVAERLAGQSDDEADGEAEATTADADDPAPSDASPSGASEADSRDQSAREERYRRFRRDRD